MRFKVVWLMDRPVSLCIWENPGGADGVPHPVHDQDSPRGGQDRTVRLVVVCLGSSSSSSSSTTTSMPEKFCIPNFAEKKGDLFSPDSDKEERCGHDNSNDSGAVGHPWPKFFLKKVKKSWSSRWPSSPPGCGSCSPGSQAASWSLKVF